jgi:RNA polymerase sigma factor (sigma-70 family)
MRFTPLEKRLEQLAAAEALLLSIDPARQYPLDFLIDRITGYRPKGTDICLVAGRDVQHDLGLLVETVSAGCCQGQAEAAEPVLSIDAAAQRLKVATKTLQRWRRRGLPARVFLYPDGKRRIGFYLTSVEAFLSAHAGELSEPATRPICDPQWLIRNAARLSRGGLWPEEVARRLAHRAGRSPLAVLSYLRQHEQTPGAEPVFASAAAAPTDAVARAAVQAMRKGVAPRRIARRFKLSRYIVYRLWMDHEVARYRGRRVRFIDDPLYHQPDAEQAISELLAQQPLEPAAPSKVPADLPPYLQDLYRTPLLTPTRQRCLFLAYNFWRCRLAHAIGRLRPETARRREVLLVRGIAAKSQAIRNEIVAANLRLVVSVAKRHLRPRLSLMDLVSEGNLTLLRAVEAFDVHRGHCFSTYASFALMRCFARAVPQLIGRSEGVEPERIQAVSDPAATREVEALEARDRLAAAWQRLSPREQAVVAGSFGLGATPSELSHGELGRQLGVSRQRVRQIEQAAIEKLRWLLGTTPHTLSPA